MACEIFGHLQSLSLQVVCFSVLAIIFCKLQLCKMKGEMFSPGFKLMKVIGVNKINRFILTEVLNFFHLSHLEAGHLADSSFRGPLFIAHF